MYTVKCLKCTLKNENISFWMLVCIMLNVNFVDRRLIRGSNCLPFTNIWFQNVKTNNRTIQKTKKMSNTNPTKKTCNKRKKNFFQYP